MPKRRSQVRRPAPKKRRALLKKRVSGNARKRSHTEEQPIEAVPSKSEASANEGSVFRIGQRVDHPLFGEGYVTQVEGDKLTIQFKVGPKEIIDSYVKLRSK